MNDSLKTDLHQPGDADGAAVIGSVSECPKLIGRYRIERVLGKGGFGLVYLAHDDQLRRLVAIKVPHAKLVARTTDAEAYLTEARTVAGLDHPNIVPVLDVGNTELFPCFVVSKYIDGEDLSSRLKQSRLSFHEAVEVVATVADALHHAHKQGLVHRDIKPGNILLDKTGKPFVGDFGLALREQDVGKGPRYAGTPAYMSPEQARGEGHRVDGRSDIFSLGVVFYELLTGRRPFQANTQDELLDQISTVEVRPLRQYDDTISKVLERICLKALFKRASERYSTVKDMADDLRHYQAGMSAEEQPALAVSPRNEATLSTHLHSPTTPLASDSRPVKIVPKGLRSFDATDADFFLELLPGPRDRDGLPEGIRFWKTRIERTDADNTFTVGLIYGPSGCGKSSLMKAGLLPRLDKSVLVVHLEATADETEARLLKGLRRQLPDLTGTFGLVETLAALRRGQYLPPDRKLLIVLDQFEQWLHARRNDKNTELVQALRHCDGGRLQCVVMVRDDFWMSATRFMRELEVRLLEGENFAAVDLFPIRHAEKVLTAFGRAFGELPPNSKDDNKEQKHFVEQTVAGLAQEGKVISVRLALFAEMVKGKPWTPATLKEVGGTEGVGVTFLEETFTASTAPPQHRLHQKAAQAVLTSLLPEAGTDIKGHMRSRQELLDTSGYANRPKEFDELLRVLDGEIRLITPTDPEGKVDDSEPVGVNPRDTDTKYYQLTHDYLVTSLRDWLTRKQKETRKGRAELLLADRSAVWNARPENRQLPSLLQSLSIRWRTAKKNWTPSQRKMMAHCFRCHAWRGAGLAVVMAALTVTGLAIRDRVVEQRNATRAEGLVQGLLNADTAQVPGLIGELEKYRLWADPRLREENAAVAANSRLKLHTSLALLPVDAGQVEYLYGRLLDAPPQDLPVIRDSLYALKPSLLDRLWAVALAPEKGKESQRLRAAAALAKYDPDSGKWKTASMAVVDDLVKENPVYLGQWSELFRPVKRALFDPLGVIFRDQRPEQTGERNLAANLLADYSADDAGRLAKLLMDADEKQFAALFPKFQTLDEPGLSLLQAAIDSTHAKELPSSDPTRETLAKRQANAAVALLRLNQPAKVWPLLKYSPDPRLRSYLIHRLSPLGAEAGAIIRQLDAEPDMTIRRALLLSLGEYGEQLLPAASRTALVPKLQSIYRTDADPGLHAAAEWLLRTWKEEAWLNQVNDEWAKDKVQREKRFETIQKLVKRDKEKTPQQWYVNSQSQTYLVIPGPVTFAMGSPNKEIDRLANEAQHQQQIGRSFAIAAKSVTLAQYRSLTKEKYEIGEKFTYDSNLPVVGINWYMAAKYCNLLSKEEGIPENQWCYEFKRQSPDDVVTYLKENYLSLTGYRLPTEAEMEYATRAGASSSRYFGETEELLGQYAWYAKSSNNILMPVGRKKPNDLGLFDAQGNCFTWCQEPYSQHPEAEGEDTVLDKEGKLEVITSKSRVLRGGSSESPASSVRSSFRYHVVPTNRDSVYGFRPARTIIP